MFFIFYFFNLFLDFLFEGKKNEFMMAGEGKIVG